MGLLNEGMRYRDLETGTFLTRDPIGYADGPNVYCYVHCNPITQFDPWGLKVDSTTTENEDGSMHTEFEIDASVVFEDDITQEQQEEKLQQIRDSIMEGFNGEEGDHTWSLKEENLNLKIEKSASDVAEDNHTIVVSSSSNMADEKTPGRAETGGGMMWLYAPAVTSDNKKTPAHEVMHFFGLRNYVGSSHNLSWRDDVNEPGNTELTSKMVRQIQANCDKEGAVNNKIGPRSDTQRRPYSIRPLREAAIHWRPRMINGEKIEERNYNY